MLAEVRKTKQFATVYSHSWPLGLESISLQPDGRGLLLDFIMGVCLDALDSHGAFAVELVGVPLVALLLAVLKALALVVLQEAVLATEMPVAEAAVADNALCGVLALLVAAADLLGRHATAQRQRHVQRCVRRDCVFAKRCGSRGQVLPGVHKTQVGGLGQVGAQCKQAAQGRDGSICGY